MTDLVLLSFQYINSSIKWLPVDKPISTFGCRGAHTFHVNRLWDFLRAGPLADV